MRPQKKTNRPRRERDPHAKEKLGNLLDSDTRNKLEALKDQLGKEEK